MVGFGAYGKIPSLGDFFRLNVSRDFVRPWDRWLQKGLSNVRTLLGDEWEQCYMSAPIWRFTLSGGLAGSKAAMGVLMPSVDRVGRTFPLTLVSSTEFAGNILEAHLSTTAIFEELEYIALDSLEDGMFTDNLGARLSEITPKCNGISSAHPTKKSPVLDAHAASIWSACVNGETRMLQCSDLPNDDEMKALFEFRADIWKTDDQPIKAQK